jgi:hypothetical protein
MAGIKSMVTIGVDEWQKEKTPGIKHRLTCEICYENKPIETYTACCNDKKFCKGCYKKIKGKPCPFCRGEMNHKILYQLCYREQEFQEWNLGQYVEG